MTASPIPALTAAVGAPRIAAIGYPPGQVFGRPGDAAGQRAVLRAALEVAVSAPGPGTVTHLPFVWPDPRSRSRSEPPEPPPIARLLTRKPWLLPHLLEKRPPL